MSEPTTPGVVARVAAALAEPDPERALLLALNEFGFVADPSIADPRTHVLVSERGRSLAIPAAALPTDTSTRDTIVQLLRLGIVRADDAEQARRLRDTERRELEEQMQRAATPVPAAPASAAAPAQRSVLVVDDELPVRTLLRRALERRGFAVREAADGRSALAAMEAGSADVIVLDMTMPDLDGAEVVRRLRASGCTTPIVLSSGYMDAALESRLDPNSFQGFLVKPFTITELSALIERVLQTHGT